MGSQTPCVKIEDLGGETCWAYTLLHPAAKREASYEGKEPTYTNSASLGNKWSGFKTMTVDVVLAKVTQTWLQPRDRDKELMER